jgi:hypothetical protein
MAIVHALRLDIAVLAIADGTGTGQRGGAAGGDRRIGDLVMPGGNLLLGSRFLDTDPTGMSVPFSVPRSRASASIRETETAPAATDGWQRLVDHVYVGAGPHPGIFSAALIDTCDNRWRGWLRFEVPRSPTCAARLWRRAGVPDPFLRRRARGSRNPVMRLC